MPRHAGCILPRPPPPRGRVLSLQETFPSGPLPSAPPFPRYVGSLGANACRLSNELDRDRWARTLASSPADVAWAGDAERGDPSGLACWGHVHRRLGYTGRDL